MKKSSIFSMLLVSADSIFYVLFALTWVYGGLPYIPTDYGFVVDTLILVYLWFLKYHLIKLESAKQRNR